MLSKRSFIRIIAVVIASFLIWRWRHAVRTLLFRRVTEKAPAPKAGNPFVREGKTLVSIVHGEEEEAMVRRAVELLGGWEKIQVAGSKVLVKPNVVAGDGPPVTTSAKVVAAVVRELYRNGAARVWVGDMSALKTLPTRANMETTGIRQAAEGAGARVLFFEEHPWIKVPVPRARFFEDVYVTECFFQADRIINLPVIKTHHNAAYSITLKNFIGATHPRQRPYLVDPRRWEEVIADLNLAYTPHLNIVDGTTIMVENGPWKGKAEKTRVIVASGDRVAADAVGLALIKSFGLWPDVAGKPVWQQKQIRRAVELGLGISDPKQITLLPQSTGGDEARFRERLRKIESYLSS